MGWLFALESYILYSMNKHLLVRIISSFLLIAYVLAVVCLLLKNAPTAVSGIQFKDIRFLGFLMDGLYTEYINEYVDYLVLFIPVGLLFPFTRGRKSLNGTLIFTVLSVAVLELFKYYCYGGIIAIDDEIWSLAGACTGYGFYSPICVAAGLRDGFRQNEGFRMPRWIGAALLFALILCCLKTVSLSSDVDSTQESSGYTEDRPSDTQSPGVPESTGSMSDAVHKAIYDRLYEELSAYNDRVVFTDDTIIPQDIFDEYVKIMDDHPEIFWLTGTAEIETVTYGSDQTLTLKPEFAENLSSLPAMASTLDATVNGYIAGCPEGTDYDKALWVHDMIIHNTQYDPDVLYYARSATDPHFDLAYTAYGALVAHKAVCAGYARAYQLILNRLGIECGYISGTAVNTKGETEAHAWNYIKADGVYYLVDVTWDDPVDEDYTDTDHLSHDYFCLSSVDMGKDHYPEEDQSIPYCPETRSPY